ncbi:cysteine desulfurase [candidate division WOR_3 bacterium SM23_42]|uniref:Cysteine desulfurase n=1 Tax=candidate division WOR_3 bacterium SM23_42 TaxID=1703779 RepID=A0A0S8FVV5_UNCW3|nr:MAG: cysteine desulfurase [candidate division WOR_3 bacterium SM23_42]
MNIYLDYQSSKPVDPRVVEAMLPYFHDKFGNPSSLHAVGDVATKTLEESRAAIAGFINADQEEILFTSGATESSNLGLIGYAFRNKNKGNRIVISETEHISIHNIAKYLEKNGFSVSKIPVDQYGRVAIQRIADRVNDKTILVSVGYANNEIGTTQSISEIGKFCRDKGIVFHSDAVAAEGLIPIDVQRDNIDLLTISSNDIYGPKGAGVLYVKEGIRINPLVIGGGQERGLRSGTENVPSIVGMKRAVEIMQEEMPGETKRFQKYRDKLIENVLKTIPRCYLNGHPTERLPSNAHFRFDGIEGESLLLSFKDKGISVSTGSACSSKTLEPSHTLIALGLLHEEAHGSLEITFGRYNKEKDVDGVMEVLPGIVERLRKLSPLYKEEA